MTNRSNSGQYVSKLSRIISYSAIPLLAEEGWRDSLIEAGAPGAKREPDRAKPQLMASSAKILLRSDHPVCAFALLGASTLEASPYRARASRPPLRGGEYRAPYDGFSHETNQSMAARRESPLTECLLLH